MDEFTRDDMNDMNDDTYGVAHEPALPAEPDRDASGRHPVNVGHLVMGVAFLGLTAIWALFASDSIDSGDLRWLMPLPWLAAGVAGLLAVVLTGRRRGGSTY